MLKYIHTVSDSAVFLYPLPSPKELEFVSWGEFTMDGRGLTTSKVGKNGATGGKEWIASAFEVLGACRDPHGCGWGLWLRWKDPDQRIHTHHVTKLQGAASALCGGLADEGLRINSNQQRAFRTYLAGCNVTGRVTIVRRTGWHDIDGHRVFVLPDESIGPKGSERVILNASAAGPYEARGSLADWQRGVGALSVGHPLPVLAISAAFAGPLLDLAGQEGGGLNIFGGSSQGKTTIIQAAAAGTRRATSGRGARRPTAWRGWRRAPAIRC